MNIIHCADVHLGSKMDSRLPPDKAQERRRELRSAFVNMVEYARKNDVKVILLAGDVFDSDRPLKKDKEFFYNVVKSNPEIDFLYLRGNHDALQSYTQELENLKCFAQKWLSYSYGNVVITGAELTSENYSSLYSALSLEADKLNIVALHGQISDSVGKDSIALSKLRNKNIDYLALGHYHSFTQGKLDGRGEYAYSGCLEGRGFDEAGEKGFCLIQTDGKINVTFVPFSMRTVNVYSVDASFAKDSYGVFLACKSAISCKKSDIVRVVVGGEVGFDNADLACEIEKLLTGENYYYIDVKDNTVRKIELKDYESDRSLSGEFIRLVMSSTEYSDEKKREIISVGLKALDGREIEL